MARGRLQRVFLLWARPLAPFACFCVYAVFALFRPSHRTDHLLELLAVSCALALAYRLAASRFTPSAVLRVALPLDTVLIGLLTLSTDRPASVALAYFWSVVLAASLLGTLDTVVNLGVAAVCAVLLPLAAGFHPDPLVQVTVVLVLLLIGGLVTLLAAAGHAAEAALARGREVDAAVLRIVERMRTTLDPSAVLKETVRALGEECDALRALVLRLEPAPSVEEWVRPGAPPYVPISTPSPASQVVLDTGRPLSAEVGSADETLERYLRANGATSLVGYPVRWHGRIVSVFGIHADRPEAWPGRSETIVSRVVDHFASALAQADAHEREQRLSLMRDELVANVSHELRTPLTSTIGFLQTLERRDASFDETTRREYISIARREAERLAVLVQDLLELSTLERGALRIDARPVDVAELLRELTVSTHEDVDVQVHAPLLVRADAGRLLQILRNLISNGLRHGRGRVTVSSERETGTVRLLVTDGGDGVAPENVPELFTPFAHWSGRSDSSGLGLAIARRIADAHGGSLTYRAAAEDVRHAFVLELPAV